MTMATQTARTIEPEDGLPLRLVGAFIRRTDLSHALLCGADLTRADLTGAMARGADFNGAILDGTILRGTDLTGARNLTPAQLAAAIIDDATILPDYIDRGEIQRARAAMKRE